MGKPITVLSPKISACVKVLSFRLAPQMASSQVGLVLACPAAILTRQNISLEETLKKVEGLFQMFEETMRSPPHIISAHRLSPRELQCLTRVCLGKHTQEIADDLILSDKTVEHYIAHAVRKLNCRNRQHAAAKAILFGIVQL
jgi:DNA-binding CsgD family transcriptional regulator